jgi:hypothetical protein
MSACFLLTAKFTFSVCSESGSANTGHGRHAITRQGCGVEFTSTFHIGYAIA